MKCADCNEELLASNVSLCPYCKSKNLVSIVTKEVHIPTKMANIVKLEKAERYAEAAREYELLGMQRKARNCKRQAIAKASKLEKVGNYEKAAKTYADLEMWEKAYNCLKFERKRLKK